MKVRQGLAKNDSSEHHLIDASSCAYIENEHLNLASTTNLDAQKPQLRDPIEINLSQEQIKTYLLSDITSSRKDDMH